jgi:chromosomal replication initiator protein
LIGPTHLTSVTGAAEKLSAMKDNLNSPSEHSVKPQIGDFLSPKYSFETFVVGKSNQFAHASALAVAERPSVYNPLFITGRTGLGKTHLIKAIGYRITQTRPEMRICYTSTQKFVEEVILSIRHDTRHKLHEIYSAKCDILLIDDIQFLAGKPSTQDEFFHIFNGLFDSGKQIVITSDRPPKEISDVHDRLISRFESGMVADVEPPELETRVAILKAKADTDKIHLGDEVAYLIATYVKANIRELEGVLTRLAAHAAIYNVTITGELVKKLLTSYISDKQRVVQLDDIIAAVSQIYGIKASDIRGPHRKKNLALARQVVMYFARELASLSSASIGQALGGRHHTTVLHGYSFVQDRMGDDPVFKNQLAQIENMLITR